MTGHINYAAAQARYAGSRKHVALEANVEIFPSKPRRRRSLFSLRRGRIAGAYAA
jgi:hypothetical protein